MTFPFWTGIVLLAAALALFAGSNRESVALGWWPLGFVLELPLYLPPERIPRGECAYRPRGNVAHVAVTAPARSSAPARARVRT